MTDTIPSTEGLIERQWCEACNTVTRTGICDCNDAHARSGGMDREPQFVNYADRLCEQLCDALNELFANQQKLLAYDEMEKALEGARAALFEPLTYHATDNLQGALYDIQRLRDEGKPTDKVCIRTIERVITQLAKADAALSRAREAKGGSDGK